MAGLAPIPTESIIFSPTACNSSGRYEHRWFQPLIAWPCECTLHIPCSSIYLRALNSNTHTSPYFSMEDCHEIHKLESLMLPFFFHCWFIVDSEFQLACIEIDGAFVHTEAAAAAAARRHNTDRRRCLFELGLLLRCGWPPRSNRRLLVPPSHCYSSTMLLWPWWWSCAFDMMLRAAKNIMVRYRLYRSPLQNDKITFCRSSYADSCHFSGKKKLLREWQIKPSYPRFASKFN